MVISGHRAESFEEANFATLSRKRVAGEWESASTNESWEVFWCELTAYHGETVELRDFEGQHEIRSDGRGEYIEVKQEHNSVFAGGEYLTRFRPYVEDRTEEKPWMESSTDAE